MTRVRILSCCLAIAVTLTGCGLRGAKQEPPPSGETFGADDTYSRTFTGAPAWV